MRVALTCGFVASALSLLPATAAPRPQAPGIAEGIPLAFAQAVNDASGAPAPVDDPDAVAPLPPWTAGLPDAGLRWAPLIQDAAARESLDPVLLASVVWVESDFNPRAVSPEGAFGLAQLMPVTAIEVGVNRMNPVQNLAGGARYLRKNLDRFGRTDLALAAYNAGPSTVVEARGIPRIPETIEYIGRVFDAYRLLTAAELAADTSPTRA
jgi:soluble lytic murein transglycosylase-like protein